MQAQSSFSEPGRELPSNCYPSESAPIGSKWPDLYVLRAFSRGIQNVLIWHDCGQGGSLRIKQTLKGQTAGGFFLTTLPAAAQQQVFFFEG